MPGRILLRSPYCPIDLWVISTHHQLARTLPSPYTLTLALALVLTLTYTGCFPATTAALLLV